MLPFDDIEASVLNAPVDIEIISFGIKGYGVIEAKLFN